MDKSAASPSLPWMDESLPRERRLEAALAAIRDHPPHTESANTYCPVCLAEVALILIPWVWGRRSDG